jgi:hypothetical protein
VKEEPEEIIAFRDSESDDDAEGMTLLQSTGRVKINFTNIYIMVLMVMIPQADWWVPTFWRKILPPSSR